MGIQKPYKSGFQIVKTYLIVEWFRFRMATGIRTFWHLNTRHRGQIYGNFLHFGNKFWPIKKNALGPNKNVFLKLGSNMSLNSDESSPRGGSSVRRTSSMRSGGGAPGRVSSSGTPIRRVEPPTPVGFGSSAPRKMSSPYTNGRTPSTSSTDRTPLAGR